MTIGPPDPIELTPTTTSVGDGRSARFIALAVITVLVSVVGYAFVNRPPPPTSPAAAVALPVATPVPATSEPPPTPLPTPTPPRNQLKGDDGIFSWPVVAQLQLDRPGPTLPADTEPRDYRYVVSIEITGGTLGVALAEGRPNAHAGSVVIDPRDVGDVVVIDVGRQWTQDGLTILEQFGSWGVELTALRDGQRGQTLLLVEYVPPGATGVPGPIVNGYTFTVLGRRDGSRLELFMELAWPATARPTR
ncbi:MAG: hypothetical protein ABI797_05495 [Chloroflexota bacterium]